MLRKKFLSRRAKEKKHSTILPRRNASVISRQEATDKDSAFLGRGD